MSEVYEVLLVMEGEQASLEERNESLGEGKAVEPV